MGANIDASLMHGPNTFSWKSVSADSVTAVLYVVCIQAVALSHCRNVAPVLHPKFCPDHSPPLRTWAPNPSCDMLWHAVAHCEIPGKLWSVSWFHRAHQGVLSQHSTTCWIEPCEIWESCEKDGKGETVIHDKDTTSSETK